MTAGASGRWVSYGFIFVSSRIGERARLAGAGTLSRLLMCRPDYFGIEYEINPWMRISNASDPARSLKQWQALVQVIEQNLGVDIQFIEPQKELPDLVFTANAGVVSQGKAVPSRFRHPERQREEQYFESWFQEQGLEVIRLDPDLYFEGAGDLLGFSDVWFGGYRQRQRCPCLFRPYGHLSQRDPSTRTDR